MIGADRAHGRHRRTPTRIAVPVVLALLLGAQDGALAADKTPTDRAKCERAGGRWDRFGLLDREQCNLPTGDAGKVCRDARDCRSACIAPEGVGPGERAGGACFGWTLLLGTCLAHVKDGIMQPRLCVD
jgi:hypothetical protein